MPFYVKVVILAYFSLENIWQSSSLLQIAWQTTVEYDLSSSTLFQTYMNMLTQTLQNKTKSLYQWKSLNVGIDLSPS